jgi:PAS domain S-box-containing protein
MTDPKSTPVGAPKDGTPVALPRLGAVPAAPLRRGPDPGTGRPNPPPDRRWWLAAAGLLLLVVTDPRVWAPGAAGLWFPPVGLGLVLVAWLGLWAAGLAAAGVLVVGLATRGPSVALLFPFLEALVVGVEVGLGWWCYHARAHGARRLGDPRSAVVFLILVPGCAAGLSALMLAAVRQTLESPAPDLVSLASALWVSHALGLLALAPPLLVLATPWLQRLGLAPDPAGRIPSAASAWPWTWGEAVETAGLVLAAAVVGVALAVIYARQYAVNWQLWALLLLLIVWTSVRQGLPGGSVAAGVAAVLGMAVASAGFPGATQAAALEGHFLAGCAAALLVGASVGWIRASEALYRTCVVHMPVVLYSARLLPRSGPGGIPNAEVTLVSPASQQVLGRGPEDLLGEYRVWFEHIHPADRELLAAALAQLCLQKQPVSCEYRLLIEDRGPTDKGAAASPSVRDPRSAILDPQRDRWLRDTLAPRYGPDGKLEGWEGVIEVITEQRELASDLRRTTAMLQSLVTHLPTGVFFVHGPMGQPLFVNARARQLLGQREDMAAGLEHLARVYRLHRSDGTPYPWEELPVSKALRLGLTGMRDDIVVHRPDGRRMPLVTWAAPVNLGTPGQVAAVWVLEDLTALRQAEAAYRESEARLRAIIETMAEGLLVQDAAGAAVEWNPAACAILGVATGAMARRTGLGPDEGCLREDGSPLPAAEHPDRVSLRTGQPVRGVVMGISVSEPRGSRSEDRGSIESAALDPRSSILAPRSPVRWILVNTLPLPAGGQGRGRVVTTFVDVTAQRAAAEVRRRSEEKYRVLVEHLPLLVLQCDRQRRVEYLNPAAEAVLGHAAEELAAGVWAGVVREGELPGLLALFAQAEGGHSAGGEFHFRDRDGGERVGYALTQPPAADGSGPGVTLLVVDVTQQRRLERELQRVQRLELIGRLAGGVVHDVNNMLTVMLTLNGLVRGNLPDDHVVQKDLGRMGQAGEQARQLVGQLLAFGKDRRVAPRHVDLSDVVRRNLELLRGTMPRGVEVAAELAAAEVWALAEEAQVQQVLMNLSFNARDAMPHGGRLTMETAASDGPASEGAAWVRLTVADTGEGMSEEVRSRIFDLFFTTKERGTGLGLAVVRQIVEGFGGRIEVASRLGQGTRFDVWLPGAAPPS